MRLAIFENWHCPVLLTLSDIRRGKSPGGISPGGGYFCMPIFSSERIRHERWYPVIVIQFQKLGVWQKFGGLCPQPRFSNPCWTLYRTSNATCFVTSCLSLVCLLAGASPQTPLWELTALPRTPSLFRGWGPRGKGRREGRGKRREERGG